MDTTSIVQAEFSFKGTNNDELCFKKGDIITVTQREDGGWWEGTLEDKTGWFPSNYVKEYNKAPLPESVRAPEEIQAFRSVVQNDLLQSESAHCAELRGLLENFLEPLESSQLLTPDEYSQLICNFVEVVDLHEDFYKHLEECNDRVGKLFLSKAPIFKKVHHAYCAMHPKAIVIVDKYKEDLNAFMEKQGAAKPGVLVLTTGLSKPFRRLDKYSAILQEFERHMESGHFDRGDTQRSIAVYKELAASCAAIRRQKELELQILTGPIRNWQGKELNTMGDIIHMGSVAVGADHRDRYFVLFPQNLLILSVSQRMSAFKYEGNIPIAGISAKRLDDTELIKNAFEITGQLIERIVAICQTSTDSNRWVELLGGKITPGIDIHMKRNTSFSSAVSIGQPTNSPPSLGTSHPTRSTSSLAQISQHKRSHSFNHHLSYNQVQANQAPPVKPSPVLPQRKEFVPASPSTKSVHAKNNWSITNLRPAHPLRPCFSTSNNNTNTQLNYALATKKVQPTYEEDALVLRVIEAYCAAFQNSSRNTMHSGIDNDEASTPTLRQLWIAIRQMQQSISEIKSQVCQERALRNHLQQILISHLESVGSASVGAPTDTC